jgi:streptogramin lyase
VFADTDLVDPCGIEVIGNRLFVSDNSTNKIIAYRLDTKEELARIQTTATSIKGIKVGPAGKLWYVDYSSNKVVRVDPV